MISPAPGYVLGRESPIDVEEEQRASGLIVRRDISDAELVKRAVVERVGAGVGTPLSWFDEVVPGSVIFYTTHFIVGDFIVVSFNNIVAYDN